MGHAVQSVTNGLGNVVKDVVQAPTQIYNDVTGNHAGGLFPGNGSQLTQQAAPGATGKGKTSTTSGTPIFNMPQATTQNTYGNFAGPTAPPIYGANFNNGYPSTVGTPYVTTSNSDNTVKPMSVQQNNYGQDGQMPNQMMSGKGGNYQNTVGSGQPIMGQPNQYMNTGGKSSTQQPLGKH